MRLELRWVQKEALEDIVEAFRGGGNYFLIQEPVAFGKTVLASALIKEAVKKYDVNCIFLAHLQELVLQTEDKFKQVAPDIDCSVLCGGLGRKEVGQVTIGTRQTIAKNLDCFENVSMIIIDEVHLYGPQYQEIVDHFLAKNPRLRVLGVTGTPYKLGQGFIYGEGKLWGDLVHQTTMDEMIELGYLSPYRYKIDDSGVKDDLKKVKRVAGEYNEGELGELMSEERHMQSVAKVIEEYAQDRRHIIVFAVTIEHAELLADVLSCECVHSKLKKDIWRDRVDRFKDGNDRILVNVSQLSIGFDAPCIDCVVFARPTQSPALFVQMAGRGLRIADGKKDCLMLDLVGNYRNHGMPSNPRIRAKGERESKRGEGDPKCAVCEVCLEVIPLGEEICPNCGADRSKEVEEINHRLEMIEASKKKFRTVSYKWVKEGHISKSGYMGDLLCIKLESQTKPIFKFLTHGKRYNKRRKPFDDLKSGDKIELTQTPYGDWFL